MQYIDFSEWNEMGKKGPNTRIVEVDRSTRDRGVKQWDKTGV